MRGSFAERLRRAELAARQWLVGRLLRDVRLPSVKIGENTITVASDILAWSASAAPAGTGQLGMNQSTGRPRAFVAGGSSHCLVEKDAANLLTGPVLPFYAVANFNAIGASTAVWALTSNDTIFGAAATEWPVGGSGVVPNKVVLNVIPLSNTVNPGNVTLVVTRNGSDTAASVTFTNGSTTGQQNSDTGSYSTSDTFGLKFSADTNLGAMTFAATIRLLGPATLA